jgi:hypothetical protein
MGVKKLMQDITLIPFADMQTGSYTALHPNVRKIGGIYKDLTDIGGWNYRNNNHFYLSSNQVRIWEHLNKCLDYGLKERTGNKMVMFSMGEAIDGVHHGTHELVSQNPTEHKETHIELFQYIQEKLEYQRGDELYCFDSTYVHTGDEESSIGAKLGAHRFDGGLYSTSFLEIEINGKLIWAYHEGVKAGEYPNKGNMAINMLKRIYYTCKVEGERVPDLILTAHVHNPHHSVWITPENKIMHYVILPSWQDKTRYVKDKMPVTKNKIGLQIIQIPANGDIQIPPPLLMTSLRGDVIKI